MRRVVGVLVAVLVTGLVLPARPSGAASRFVLVPFPTIESLAMAADPGLCEGDLWQYVARENGKPFDTTLECSKYAALAAHDFTLPAYSYRHSWPLLSPPFAKDVPQNLCTGIPGKPCMVYYKALGVPLGEKTYEYGRPVVPVPDMPTLSTSGTVLQGSVGTVDTSSCHDAPGTFDFTASGRTLGSYAGTFTASGTLTFAPGITHRVLTGYSITVLIDSAAGRVDLSYEGLPPSSSNSGSIDCIEFGGFSIVHASIYVPYEGTIVRGDEVEVADSGTSIITFSFANNGLGSLVSPFEADLQSQALPDNSTLPLPAPVCPPAGCT